MLLVTYLKKYVLSKTKDVNVKVFNMITKMNESKTLVKHISCDCKYKFNSVTCNSNQKLNNDKCQCICQNGKYLKSVVDNSVIACDKL